MDIFHEVVVNLMNRMKTTTYKDNKDIHIDDLCWLYWLERILMLLAIGSCIKKKRYYFILCCKCNKNTTLASTYRYTFLVYHIEPYK